jgi:hypothetical protein
LVLEGKHGEQACLVCHPGYQAQGTSRDCQSCHLDEYDRTTQPNHRQTGYSTQCDQCHRFADTDWHQGRFDHDVATAFPLVGKHAQVACEQCHLGGQYAGTPKDCYSCHWVRSQDDPWRLQIGQDCGQCHSPEGWKPAQWDHGGPPASWPLEGVHAERGCLDCHPGYQAQGTSPDCYGCHRAEYESTQDPDHQANGFPTDCSLCHRVRDRDWLHGTYDHAWYPLDGQHNRIRCKKCHPIPNDFTLGSTRCLTCHDRKHKNDPCAECHYTDNWKHTR